MKGSLTRSMAWLHSWGGMLLGWVLFVVMWTGTIAMFHDEIGAWMQPERVARAAPPDRGISTAQAFFMRVAPGADRWTIMLDDAETGLLDLAWDGDAPGTATIEGATGRRIVPRETEGGHFLVSIHFELHAGRAGLWIVAASGLFMLVAIVSGIIIHKRILRDFFMLRFHKGQRSWLDAHNVASVTTLPFQIMIALTGILIFPTSFMPAAIDMLYAGDRQAFVADYYRPFTRPADGITAPMRRLAPLVRIGETRLGEPASFVTVDHPGDAAAVMTVHGRTDARLSLMDRSVALDMATGRVIGGQLHYSPAVTASGILSGLHFGSFGGAPVRWIYLLLGLAGSAMVATGLVLFLIKRGPALPAPARRLCETLTVAAVAGPVLATIVYLWANRLLPAALEVRAGWEVASFFAAWALSAVHAAPIPYRRAWCQQLGFAAFLAMMLPILNIAATGECWLAYMLRADWGRAGVELTAVAMGLGLALTASTIADVRRMARTKG